jgi:uncharacterized protein
MSDPVSRPRALITGASSGIGVAYAERLAREGYDLVLVARRRDRLTELAERLKRGNGISADVLCADLTHPADLAKVETLAGGDEALTLLINNAGFAGYQPFVSIDPEVIDDLIDIHVRTVTRLSRAVLPGHGSTTQRCGHQHSVTPCHQRSVAAQPAAIARDLRWRKGVYSGLHPGACR